MQENLTSPSQKLFAKTDFETDSVIQQGIFLEKLETSKIPIPNPEYQKETDQVKQCIETIRDSEELLIQCIPYKGKQAFQFRRKILPKLIQEAITTGNINTTEEEQERIIDIFNNSDDRNTLYYLENLLGETNIYKTLCEYSKRYFEHKYLLQLVDRSKKLFKDFFPELLVEFPFTVSFMTIDIENYQSAEHSITKDGTHELEIINSIPLDQERNYDELEIKSVFQTSSDTEKKTYIYRRRINDLILMIHEYAHGIFYEFTKKQKADGKENTTNEQKTHYYFTLDAALNEGFAVLMETLIINRLIEHAEEFDLDQRDLSDLKHWKGERFLSLLKKQRIEKEKGELTKATAYSQGFIRLMTKIYRSGGIDSIKEFLERIDSETTLSITRDSELFREMISYRTPTKELLEILEQNIFKK